MNRGGATIAGIVVIGLGAFLRSGIAKTGRSRASESGSLPHFDRSLFQCHAPTKLPELRANADARSHAARQLDRSTAILAGSVLLDSTLEHYRGSFENRGMYLPLAVASAAVSAGLTGNRGGSAARRLRLGTYVAAGLTGVIGFAFHAYNVTKRPGGVSWHNLFYAAPIGAPGALTLAGVTGLCAERIRATPDGEAPTILGQPADRSLAALTSAGIIADVAEVWLLHFRGAFHNPAMFLPVTVPPVASLLLAGTALNARWAKPATTRRWLWATAALGIGGVAFHAYGVQRMMGGWRNWSQNVLDGPPLPAPPSYTGLALAGLAALTLKEARMR